MFEGEELDEVVQKKKKEFEEMKARQQKDIEELRDRIKASLKEGKTVFVKNPLRDYFIFRVVNFFALFDGTLYVIGDEYNKGEIKQYCIFELRFNTLYATFADIIYHANSTIIYHANSTCKKMDLCQYNTV